MDEVNARGSHDRLRQERIQHNWRQQDLADRVGTTVVTVNRWERGVQQPSMYFREKLCALFGKSAEELGLTAVNTPEAPPHERESSAPTPVPKLWTVPYRRNPYFTGRDDLLHLLEQHLSGTSQERGTPLGSAALTQPHAMKGLGGIGKTQIAVEYAYRAREQGTYTHTLWINAASQEAIITSFTVLADVIPEFPAKNETDQQKLVTAIKQWLEQCPERWLVIFDNADDPSLIHAYIPRSGYGNILLTTRAHAVGSLATALDVEKMNFIEGTHLLLRRAQRLAQASDEEINEAGNIVVALDHFPLALEQAGAYIEETGCSLSDYLHLYHTHRSALLARRGAQSTNYPDSVATTWSLSFQRVEQANPAAAELLRLCAFLAPDSIPEELLVAGAPHWPPMLQQAVTDPFAFDQMLEALLAFSLVKRLAREHVLSLHRLVQVVQQERMNSEEHRQWAERIVYAVNAIFPRDPEEDVASWPDCLRYLEQVRACDTLIQQQGLVLPEAADVLERAVLYLREHALYMLAEPLCHHILQIREQSMGSEHPDTATSLKNIGVFYTHQAKFEQAEALFLRALSIYERLGSHHPEMASVLNRLANLYAKQGKYVEAEPLFQRALHIWEQSPMSGHSEVTAARAGLATLYAQQGKYVEAELLFQHALRIWEQSLGSEHPWVTYPLNGLANLYREQGKYVEAEPFYKRALQILEQKQDEGTEHALNGLADLYREQGEYVKAEPLYQRALRIREQKLGLEHPDVASALNGLADLYRRQGKDAEAEPLYQRALHIRERTLEPDHPDTADTLQGMAALRAKQGETETAVFLYSRALAIREKVYGQQHSKTTDTRERLYALLQRVMD